MRVLVAAHKNLERAFDQAIVNRYFFAHLSRILMDEVYRRAQRCRHCRHHADVRAQRDRGFREGLPAPVRRRVIQRRQIHARFLEHRLVDDEVVDAHRRYGYLDLAIDGGR